MILLLCAHALLLSDVASVGHRSGREGIEEVIQLLKHMVGSFNVQSKEDKGNWEAYSAWSEGEEKDRTAFIQEQQGVVMSATAQFNANKEQKETLERQLTELAGEIQQTRSSIGELVQLRTDEHKAHQEDLADLTKTIEATNKAVEVLEGHYAAASVAQVRSEVTRALSTLALSSKSQAGVSRLAALLADPGWLGVDGDAAYAAGTAGSGGGGVVETLKSVRSTLLDNKQASIEKENDARRQYEDAKAAKDQDLARSTEEQGVKSTALEEAGAKMQAFTAAIAGATQDIADAEAFKKALMLDREHFGQEFQKRSMTRESEQEATQAALDALQEVSVAGFLQQDTFVSTKLVACPKCAAAVKNLLKVGQESHSSNLVQLGTAITQQLTTTSKAPAAYFDPKAMQPVTDLLKQLIQKLEDELTAETSHHDWCETEKSTSAAAKKEREGNIESLTAEIGQLETKLAGLASEISFLHAELVRAQTETETATQLRTQEHATYSSAKQEHDEVISALEKAMSALSGSFALLQRKAVDRHRGVALYQARVGFKSPFTDFGPSQGGSAVDMLQDLLARYSSARTELVHDEDVSQKAYEQLMARNVQFRKDTTQQKQAKETEARQAKERYGNAQAELQANHNELAQVEQYIADLRPSCDDIRSTFAERKQRREAEIAALKETLAVLEDPSVMR